MPSVLRCHTYNSDYIFHLDWTIDTADTVSFLLSLAVDDIFSSAVHSLLLVGAWRSGGD